jgi:hypothetical protein
VIAAEPHESSFSSLVGQGVEQKLDPSARVLLVDQTERLPGTLVPPRAFLAARGIPAKREQTEERVA